MKSVTYQEELPFVGSSAFVSGLFARQWGEDPLVASCCICQYTHCCAFRCLTPQGVHSFSLRSLRKKKLLRKTAKIFEWEISEWDCPPWDDANTCIFPAFFFSLNTQRCHKYHQKNTKIYPFYKNIFFLTKTV